ncbi:MAG: M48 family metalloprotease [Alphaproteobacteria bacterium]|nr:M48 family metalloprotease [Alphaproteobacteria bacterium]
MNVTTPKTGLQTHIWNNNLKSIGLLAFYPFLIMGLVWVIAWALGVMNTGAGNFEYAGDFATSILYAYWPVILLVVGLWFMIAWFFHTRMIRNMSHSHPVTRKEEPELYNLLENLCISVGMKMPRLEIIETHARNAFASGVNDKTYCVTVTRGLLHSLSKDEVEAVLAHELAHILNRDVRLLIVTIIFTSMVGFAAQMVWSNVRYALWVPRSRAGSGSGQNRGNGVLILLAIAIILWVGYMATLFTRFALSRRREYMADAGAVQMTRNPEGMMRALLRISGAEQIPKMPMDVNMMCIENRIPFLGLFATHPPIDKRIRAISDTTATPIPDLPELHRRKSPRVSHAETVSPWSLDHPRTNWTTRERFRSRRKASPWKS